MLLIIIWYFIFGLGLN